MNSIARFVVFDFFSYFHDWTKVLKLNMSKSRWVDFISINFMIFFSPNLDQNIGYEL